MSYVPRLLVECQRAAALAAARRERFGIDSSTRPSTEVTIFVFGSAGGGTSYPRGFPITAFLALFLVLHRT